MNGRIAESCKLCGSESTFDRDHAADLCYISGCRCGGFWIDLRDYKDFLARDTWLDKASRRELSSLLRERSIHHDHDVLLQIKVMTQPDSARRFVAQSYDEVIATWPQSVAERLDRVLLNLAALSPIGGQLVPLAFTQNGRDLALVFARTDEEAVYHVRALVDQGRLAPVATNDLNRVMVTPAGWHRIEELQSLRSSRKNPPFVAMWFGGETDKAAMDAIFEAICRACEAAGYRNPIRSDSEQNNDFIMDKILGDIRRSPFVIADFTGNRHGVYIEAGFARGREKPVIHTCRSDHFENAHFDIKQIYTIKWTNLDELQYGVTQRIRGTIGEGPMRIPDSEN